MKKTYWLTGLGIGIVALIVLTGYLLITKERRTKTVNNVTINIREKPTGYPTDIPVPPDAYNFWYQKCDDHLFFGYTASTTREDKDRFLKTQNDLPNDRFLKIQNDLLNAGWSTDSTRGDNANFQTETVMQLSLKKGNETMNVVGTMYDEHQPPVGKGNYGVWFDRFPEGLSPCTNVNWQEEVYRGAGLPTPTSQPKSTDKPTGYPSDIPVIPGAYNLTAIPKDSLTGQQLFRYYLPITKNMEAQADEILKSLLAAGWVPDPAWEKSQQKHASAVFVILMKGNENLQVRVLLTKPEDDPQKEGGYLVGFNHLQKGIP